jgi:hypothetical protein
LRLLQRRLDVLVQLITEQVRGVKEGIGDGDIGRTFFLGLLLLGLLSGSGTSGSSSASCSGRGGSTTA